MLRVNASSLRTVLLTVWVTCLAGGLVVYRRYEGTPGAAGAVPQTRPTDRGAGLGPDGRFTLVAALHPRCPCSRATVRELERVVARCGGSLGLRVLVVRPDGAGDGWERTDLWNAVAALPGATVAADAGGREAQRLGAETSGQVVLYDPRGRLVFHGGITTSRGHEGDNPGSDAIVAAVLADPGAAVSPPVVIDTPVYGCPLSRPAARLGADQ
ncbi:MAG: hypothetical protein JWO31_1997 [Phycisphaerales bacterium]|nr:hypothetical protein [Phycisphaerales bacterium]